MISTQLLTKPIDSNAISKPVATLFLLLLLFGWKGNSIWRMLCEIRTQWKSPSTIHYVNQWFRLMWFALIMCLAFGWTIHSPIFCGFVCVFWDFWNDLLLGHQQGECCFVCCVSTEFIWTFAFVHRRQWAETKESKQFNWTR